MRASHKPILNSDILINMASSSTNLTLKLLIDTKREKVLFAEASKEVVDFLFNLLCLPIGTVVRLLTKDAMVGCLGNLYDSVENLNDTYMQPNLKKDVLLKPTALISSTKISGLLPVNDRNVDGNLETSKFYTCSTQYHRDYVTCDINTVCPSNCGYTMNHELQYVGKTASEMKPAGSNNSGFVKEVVTYMVMDDLVVQPMSSISSITLLNKFNVKEIGVLQERVVKLGMEEGINLLKASLQSNMILTSTFLKNLESQGLE